MKKILFPTEFADHAPEVFHYSLELARRFKAKVIVLHAIGKPEVKVTSSNLTGLADHAMDVLVDFVNKYKSDFYDGVELQFLVETGFPGEVIKNVAQQQEADLIVMGMTGKTNALEKVFGSVSTDVLSDADAPVLLIPAGWKYRWFHKIVYATDFAFRDIGALTYLKKMAKVFNAEIDCLHVVEEGEDLVRARINMNMLKKALTSKVFNEFDVLNGQLVNAINNYLKEENAGMLVMLSRKRGMWEKIMDRGRTKEVARKIRLPLLVFKENAYEEVGWKIDLNLLLPG